MSLDELKRQLRLNPDNEMLLGVAILRHIAMYPLTSIYDLSRELGVSAAKINTWIKVAKR